MSEKLSLIPATATSLATTDLLYLAADQGGGVFAENKLPVSVVDGRFVLKSGDVVSGNLYVTGLGTSGVASPPMANFQFTVQDALTQTSMVIFNNRTPGGAAGSGGAASLFLWSNTLSPYAWIIRADGATDNLLFQDEGVGNKAYIPAQAVPAFGIGSPSPGFSVLFHRIADGLLMLTNAAGTDFGRLQLGGTTSAFPSIKRNGAGIDFRLADDSAYAKITTDGIQMSVASLFSITSGTNTRAGNAVLVAGTVTVANTTVTADTLVLLTRKTSGGTIGTSITYTVSAGASFTITSDNILDTSTFTYFLMERP